MAILSHMRRDADWILPRLFRIFAFWGNAELDLTHVLLGPGTSTIEIKVIDPNAPGLLEKIRRRITGA